MAKKNKKFSLLLSGKFDYSIVIITLLLLSVGLIVLLSASAPKSLSEGDSSYEYFKRQSMFAALGIVCMIILSKMDYRILKAKSLRWLIYFVTVGILVAVGLTGLEEGGGRRWIKILGFSFQPSEFAKVSLIVVFAGILSDVKEKGKIKSIFSGFLLPIILLAPIAFTILILQNHFSATFIIAAIICIQMFVVGTRLTYFIGAGGLGAIALAVYLLVSSSSSEGSDFRFDRIQTWLNPEADFIGKGWQINQSLFAIGSGGMFGLGLGNSKQKYLYLPEPQNDFIFAVLAEELGFIGCAVVIILFAVLIWRGMTISMKAPDMFGSLLAAGITSMIAIQVLINIAVVTASMPVTGMALPFFSYGGTALMINLAAMGILLSISRAGNKE